MSCGANVRDRICSPPIDFVAMEQPQGLFRDCNHPHPCRASYLAMSCPSSLNKRPGFAGDFMQLNRFRNDLTTKCHCKLLTVDEPFLRRLAERSLDCSAHFVWEMRTKEL